MLSPVMLWWIGAVYPVQVSLFGLRRTQSRTRVCSLSRSSEDDLAVGRCMMQTKADMTCT